MTVAMVVAAIVVLAGLDPVLKTRAASAASQHDPGRPISWLVAGDSYSAGQGLPYEGGECARADAGAGRHGPWG
ncbi:MAG: hypothetical protein M3256_19735, partial [Actinomycetota bacterium]|nr:hypothetical protein [Actinomycetota bacterium]